MNDILYILVGIFCLAWTIAGIALPFLVWGIYNRTRATADSTARLADFFDDRNVEISNPRPRP